MENIIEINNLYKSYNDVHAVNNLSFRVKKGELFAFLGVNGAGKSTTISIMCGTLTKDSGEVLINGKNIDHQLVDITKELGVVFQNSVLDNNLTVKDNLYSRASLYGIYGNAAKKRIEELAEILDFKQIMNRAVGKLSGGQKRKIDVARALLHKPEILILDEPTNYLDIEAKVWLEEFLLNFDNTVIVVSHDRHFLNKVCTHMLDIDYGKITLFIGNYDFWYESSQLILKQMKDSNKKKEEKIKELKDFIARFSANASKSKQATSRKKSLEKIELEEMKASSRRYPYINFEVERPLGKDVLELKGISKTIDGEVVLKNMNLTINTNDKVGFVGTNELAITTLFKIITGELEPDSGEVKWGTTVKYDYFPKNHDKFFDNNYDLIDWLRQYSKEQEEPFIRGFLGRMLFSGDEALKKVKVLSGGEKVRCMMSKLMLSGANVLVMDDPTNHLDIESITSLNKGMENFKGALLFSSHDHELLSTVANRIIEFKEDGKYVDKMMNYDEYLESVK